MEGASVRRCRLRFGRAPDPERRARLEAAIAAVSPPPVLRWEGDTLHLEYAFPDGCFEDSWNALREAGIDRDLRSLARMGALIRSTLEHNEREFLRHPAGWRRHLDRVYLACAADPAAPAARGGRLWRKHERKE